MERMFNAWLAETGAEVEAMIFRSPNAWCPDQYIFRFRMRDGEWSGAHLVPWCMDTFARAAGIIGEAGSVSPSEDEVGPLNLPLGRA